MILQCCYFEGFRDVPYRPKKTVYTQYGFGGVNSLDEYARDLIDNVPGCGQVRGQGG